MRKYQQEDGDQMIDNHNEDLATILRERMAKFHNMWLSPIRSVDGSHEKKLFNDLGQALSDFIDNNRKLRYTLYDVKSQNLDYKRTVDNGTIRTQHFENEVQRLNEEVIAAKQVIFEVNTSLYTAQEANHRLTNKQRYMERDRQEQRDLIASLQGIRDIQLKVIKVIKAIWEDASKDIAVGMSIGHANLITALGQALIPVMDLATPMQGCPEEQVNKQADREMTKREHHAFLYGADHSQMAPQTDQQANTCE